MIVQYKWFVLPAVGVIAVIVAVLVWGDLASNLVYYLTPTEAIEQRAEFPEGTRFRLGGLVEPGSVSSQRDVVSFVVTDGEHDISVDHTGTPPQLFRENIGVIVEGTWRGDRIESDSLVVSHDEQYRAPDSDEPYRPPTGEAQQRP